MNVERKPIQQFTCIAYLNYNWNNIILFNKESNSCRINKINQGGI